MLRLLHVPVSPPPLAPTPSLPADPDAAGPFDSSGTGSGVGSGSGSGNRSSTGGGGGTKDKPPATKKAIDFFDHLEIYPGSKTTHFEKLRKASGIEYADMLFFDDEARNKNVENLGVTMWLVRDGLTCGEVDCGVREWRKRRGFAGTRNMKDSERGDEDTRN